jgi:hypothetical protein
MPHKAQRVSALSAGVPGIKEGSFMSGYRDQIDTSHYGACRTYLLTFQQRYRFRLTATIILLICNLYFQTIYFAKNYTTGESIQAVIYNNDGLAVSPTTGILMVLYMAVFLIVGWAMYKKGVRKKMLGIYVVANILVMTGYSIYQNVQNSHVHREGAAPNELPFAYMMLAVFFSIANIALAFFGEQKRPRLHIALILVTVAGALTTCYNWIIAGILLLLYLLAIPEFKKMQWVMQQQGYPYFSEEFEQAKLHSEYEPMHKLDNRSYGEMEDIDGSAPAADTVKAQEEAHRQESIRANTPTMDYTLKVSDDPAEMPGIDDIFDHVEPLPEPEPPKAEDIPDTKWDVPDVKADIPDTKWDVPDVNADIPDTKWNVPDVNTDIPDLPDIPDIPQI